MTIAAKYVSDQSCNQQIIYLNLSQIKVMEFRDK